VSTVLLEKRKRRTRRRRRIRAKVAGTADRPRLSVHRSNRGIFAQLVDDERGHTLVSVSWIEGDLHKLRGTEQATRIGALLAERAQQAGITSCVLDRGGYRYHGRVRALADGARGGGLEL
jgi:large subunit ribosomal protein L18